MEAQNETKPVKNERWKMKISMRACKLHAYVCENVKMHYASSEAASKALNNSYVGGRQR